MSSRRGVALVVALLLSATTKPARADDPDRIVFKPVTEFNATGTREKYEVDPDKLCALEVQPHGSRVVEDNDYANCRATSVVMLKALSWARQVEAARRTSKTAQSDLATAQRDLERWLARIGDGSMNGAPLDVTRACQRLSDELAAHRAELAQKYPQTPETTPTNSVPVRSELWRLLMSTSISNEAMGMCRDRAERVRTDMLAKRIAAVASRSISDLAQISETERLPEEQKRIDNAIATCRTSVEARRSERRGIAATRPIGELRAIPDAFRLPEEQQRLDREEAKHTALVESRKHDPKWASPVLSAAVCFATVNKNAAAEEIRTERSYAKQYGGFVDAKKIYDLQQGIRSMDEAIMATRGLMHKLRVAPQPCAAKLVKQLVVCLPFGGYQNADSADECSTEQIREYVEIADVAPFD